eukprot:4903933-Amphidinium_carterae.1
MGNGDCYKVKSHMVQVSKATPCCPTQGSASVLDYFGCALDLVSGEHLGRKRFLPTSVNARLVIASSKSSKAAQGAALDMTTLLQTASITLSQRRSSVAQLPED